MTVRALHPCGFLFWQSARRIGLRLALGDVEALAEALNASRGVQNALRASIEWMALGAHINMHLALGAADCECVAAGAGNASGLIRWVDSRFHVG